MTSSNSRFSGHEELGEAWNLAARQPGPHAYTLGRVASLGDGSAEVVQLREMAAVLVGDEQAHVLEPIREELGHA